MALPGERVAIHDGIVVVNDKPLRVEPGALGGVEEDGGAVRYGIIPSMDSMPVLRVPQGQVFVLGDNRASSKDSRHFGSVPLGTVTGVAEYLFSGGQIDLLR